MCARAAEDANSKLRRRERIVAAHFDDKLAKVGLKTTQLDLLSEVFRLQPVCPGELARALSIDPFHGSAGGRWPPREFERAGDRENNPPISSR